MYNYVFDDNGVFIANLSNTADQLGIGQYRFPLNFELAGMTIKLGGHEIVFNCGKGLEYDGKKFEYACQKLEKDLYFVSFGLCALALDAAAKVATLIDGYDWFSGPIDGSEGEGHPSAGDEMVDTEVAWVFGCGRYTSQKYISESKCVVGWAPVKEQEQEMEYKARKVGISFYLVDVKGEAPRNCCAPMFTDRVILLQDYERMMCVGVVQGKEHEPIPVAGYAQYLEQL